jgi:hypothetical protein
VKTREEMIIYWREAAEAAEAKIIEQRQDLSNLRMALDSVNERLHAHILEVDQLKAQLTKRLFK